jgi:hypothetical protein
MSPASWVSMWWGLCCFGFGVESMRWGLGPFDGFILPAILFGCAAFFILLSNRI